MYQSMSPDNLGSSSVRKPNNHYNKSSKEDHQNFPENGRISSSNGNTSTLAPTQHPHPPQNLEQQQIGHINITTQISNSIQNQTQSHESSPSRDVLLQWGQRKRSRCSRTENRSMAVTSEKHQTATIAMAPPLVPPSVASTSSNGSRSGGGSSRVRPNNGLLYSKDPHGFLPSKSRNVSDQMGCSNGASPSRNGVGNSRASMSRSSNTKRSPSCVVDKTDNKKASGSMRKVKSDDSLGNHHNHHHHHGESAEQENSNGGHHHHHHQATAAALARSPVAESGEKANGEVVEWPRIYLSLSRKEKEDDFYAMKGTKLPHRPKKRAKAVDRALQYCFPGLWLSDLTRARYEVRERKSAKKPKRRGLKGLESMESESE